MSTCILHVGAAKTGTSAIQESLFYGLGDPRFRYVNLGYLNAGSFLDSVFNPEPEKYWYYQMQNWSSETIRRHGQIHERRLRKLLRQCRSSQVTPILSAERCWVASTPLLERLRDFLAAEGFVVRVVAYVRPAKSWIESAFQQKAKLDRSRMPLRDAMRDRDFIGEIEWVDKLANFERVFGQGSVMVRPFRRSALLGGCVVLDFCNSLGIRFESQAVRRVNESLPLDAVRMLYAYNRFARADAPPGLGANETMEMEFQRMQGEPFRFHSSFVAPLADHIEAQNRRLLDRYGVDLSEDLTASDGGPCIRDESGLFEYRSTSLAWLGRISGEATIAAGSGELTARKVAGQVAVAMRRPHLRCRLEIFLRRVRFRLRWLRCGD